MLGVDLKNMLSISTPTIVLIEKLEFFLLRMEPNSIFKHLKKGILEIHRTSQ